MTVTKKSKLSMQKVEEQVNKYMDRVFQHMISRDPYEKEFHQAVRDLFVSIRPVLMRNTDYMKFNILERLVEPERLITFSIPWMDDKGTVQVNRGFRVQFNSALGPYKGGLRFHPSVNSSIVKFLGFEQTFKNALTNQPIGGGKGGSDFNPKGKSDAEIMRFCQSFMTELHKYIGPDTDVPAGDIGVGAKEIGYLFGQYKKLRGRYEAGVLTGKGLHYGGSIGRKEATGYGAIYFVNEMLKDMGETFQDKTMVVSGSGNVSIHTMEKAMEMGATVVACSDSNGYIYDENGIDLQTVKQLKEIEKRRIQDYVEYHPHAIYEENCSHIWKVPCNIAMPCATQNEIDEEEAKELVENEVMLVAEGANMPSTTAAVSVFLYHDVAFAPAKAVNAGGVAVSALEMGQNSSRIAWSFEQVDEKLQEIMKDIYRNCVDSAKKYHKPGNLIVGADRKSVV